MAYLAHVLHLRRRAACSTSSDAFASLRILINVPDVDVLVLRVPSEPTVVVVLVGYLEDPGDRFDHRLTRPPVVLLGPLPRHRPGKCHTGGRR